MAIDNTAEYTNLMGVHLRGEDVQDGAYLLLHVLRRKKDFENNETNFTKKHNVIKTYICKSFEEYLESIEEAIKIANALNARLYGSLRFGSAKSAMHTLLVKCAESIKNKEAVPNIFGKTMSAYNTSRIKTMPYYWFIDVDFEDITSSPVCELHTHLSPFIEKHNINVTLLRTNSGYHIILKPIRKEYVNELIDNINNDKYLNAKACLMANSSNLTLIYKP